MLNKFPSSSFNRIEWLYGYDEMENSGNGKNIHSKEREIKKKLSLVMTLF